MATFQLDVLNPGAELLVNPSAPPANPEVPANWQGEGLPGEIRSFESDTDYPFTTGSRHFRLTGTFQRGQIAFSDRINVAPSGVPAADVVGDTITLTYDYAAAAIDTQANIGVRWFNAAGSAVGSQEFAGEFAPASTQTVFSNAPTFIVPAGAETFEILIFTRRAANVSTTDIGFDNFVAEIETDADVPPSAFITATYLSAIIQDLNVSSSASTVYASVLIEEASRPAETTAIYMTVLHSTTPPPPFWHYQWRFIELRQED